ncbi:MAG TPA: hypothetical protein VLM89_12855 [Phycisphaerae bacterium]|nr:hypothetical protein [Phycisphaerae bacterium]
MSNSLIRIGLLTALCIPASLTLGAPVDIWKDGQVNCRLILPPDDQGGRLVGSTINRYLREWYGVELQTAAKCGAEGTFILAGTPRTNPEIARLVREGLLLTEEALGDEGYQLVAHEDGSARCVVIHGRTPRALKHGCQELLFYHMPFTAHSGAVNWPLNIIRRPAVGYRGTYMLPCWAAYDSYESWDRVLRFNSELTLNRNWFWLDGFPVAGHTGEYAGTDLADGAKVQRLLDLATGEDMKILIGGGWFNWHHQKAIGKDTEKGIEYYLAYIDTFRNFHGFYIEPTGEGKEIQNWRPEADALCKLIGLVLERKPEFEFAIAIGKFNNSEYLRQMARLDSKRVYWWWCWGDPLRDKTLDLYPTVLRWHTNVRMSDFHGTQEPPQPQERVLAGVVTSYDPGQGFGNPWDGWAKLGVDRPRNFHPYTIPYFGHEYFYRERCWDLDITEEQFVSRLQCRLFDVDAPANAAANYWRLTRLVLACEKTPPSPDDLAPVRAFLRGVAGRGWTPRMQDTLSRMTTAIQELDKPRSKPSTP